MKIPYVRVFVCVGFFSHRRVAERIRNVTILLNLVPSFSVRDQSSVSEVYKRKM